MRRTFGSTLLLTLLPVLPAGAQPFSILYHETFAAPSVVENVKPSSASPSQTTSLSFQAFGRRFDVALEKNERLTTGAPRESAGIELYRGELVGQSGTWARINRHGKDWSGAIFDGVELYLIEPYDAVSRLLAVPRSTDGRTIVYRWSDATGEFADEVISDHGAQRPQTQALLEHLRANSALSSPQQVGVGFIADFEFSQYGGGTPDERVLAMANIVDGIFGSQIGVFIAPQVEVFSTGTDPFTATEPLALLDELETYKFNTPMLRTLGLAHLFTGRELVGDVVGLANRGMVCDERFGAGLTQATFGTGGSALIAAHEIAHNLGAPHDVESGSPCSASPTGFLMDPNFNASSTLSQCSRDEIARTLVTATCLESVPPSDLALGFGSLPANPAVFTNFVVEIIVDNATTGAEARNASVNLTLGGVTLVGASGPSGWSCDSQALLPVCRIDRLPAGRSDVITLTLRIVAPSPNLHAEITSLSDPNAANDTLDHLFSTAPTADLAATMTPDYVEMHSGEERAITITVRNQRFGDAVGVNARVDFTGDFDVLEINPSLGSCIRVGAHPRFDCGLGTIAVGEARTISARLKAHDRLRSPDGWEYNYQYVQTSMVGTAEAAPADDVGRAMVVVAERFFDLASTIAGPTDLAVESTGRYTVTVVNNGPETATDVNVSLFYFTSSIVASIESVTGGTCVVETTRVYCELPTMAPGQSHALTANLRPTAEGVFTLWAQQYARGWDRQPANNRHEVTLAVPGATAPPPSSPPPPSPPPPSPPPPTPPAPSPPPTSSAGGGGGGGGAIGILGLAALLAATAVRRRQR